MNSPPVSTVRVRLERLYLKAAFECQIKAIVKSNMEKRSSRKVPFKSQTGEASFLQSVSVRSRQDLKQTLEITVLLVGPRKTKMVGMLLIDMDDDPVKKEGGNRYYLTKCPQTGVVLSLTYGTGDQQRAPANNPNNTRQPARKLFPGKANPLKAIPSANLHTQRPRSIFETTPAPSSRPKMEIFMKKEAPKNGRNALPFNMKESGQVGMKPRLSKTNNFLKDHSLNHGNPGTRQRSISGLGARPSPIGAPKRTSVRPFKAPNRNMFQTAPSSGTGLYSNGSGGKYGQTNSGMKNGDPHSKLKNAMRGSIPLKSGQKVGSMQINNKNEETMSIRSRVSRTRGARGLNTSVMSREKRLERYSRRADRRSRSPGGGIKIRFGESKKKRILTRGGHSRSEMKGNLNKSVEGRGGKKKGKRPGDKLNQTAIEPGEKIKKGKGVNIFGNFSGGGLGKAKKVIGKGKRSSKAFPSQEENDELRNSFDTNTESSMMNSVSDISANHSVMSNVTGKSRRRKPKTQIFDGVNTKKVTLKATISEQDFKIDTQKTQLSEQERQIARLESENRDLGFSLSTMTQKADSTRDELEEIRRSFLQRESQSGHSSKQKEIILEQQIGGLQKQLELLESQRNRSEEEKNRMLIEADRQDREVESLREKQETERRLKEKAEGRLGELKQAHRDELGRQETRLETLKREHQEQITRLESASQQGKGESSTLRTQLETKNTELRLQVERLKDEVAASRRNSQSQHDSSLTHLREEKSRLGKEKDQAVAQIKTLREMLSKRDEIIALKEKRLLEMERQQNESSKSASNWHKDKLEMEIKLVEKEEQIEREREKATEQRARDESAKNQHSSGMATLREQVGSLKAKIQELEKNQTTDQSGDIQVLKYENEKLKKNSKKLEMKVAQLKGNEKSKTKEKARLERRLEEASKGLLKLSDLENLILKREDELANIKKAYQSSEFRLKESVQKIGNALQMLEGVRFKGKKDKDKLMNALIGVS